MKYTVCRLISEGCSTGRGAPWEMQSTHASNNQTHNHPSLFAFYHLLSSITLIIPVNNLLVGSGREKGKRA